MQDNLVGYLMNALDPEETRQVEEWLAATPEARNQLERLRVVLKPLAEDRALAVLPPPGLVERTLRAVATHRAKHESVPLRPTLKLPALRSVATTRSRWSRPDVLIAAGVGFVILMMMPPALLLLRQQQHRVECANNLGRFYGPYSQFAADHGGALPGPQPQGPHAMAGATLVQLRDADLWNDQLKVVCPSSKSTPAVRPPTSEELAERFQREGYTELCRMIGGGYAYPLGYVDEQQRLRGYKRQDGDGIPIMADRSPRQGEVEDWREANSPNHGGKGQNVLFLGGNVRYLTRRSVEGDDIFLNKQGKQAAGRGVKDVVLAPGDVPPLTTRETD